MVDILLVNPPVMMPEVDKHARILPPLSLGYIAAVLLENNYSVDFIDMNVPMKPEYNIGWGFEVQRLFENLKTEIKNKKPLILGISTHTETYPNSLKIAEIAAPAPAAVKILCRESVRPRSRPTVATIPAPDCAAGASGPTVPPVPMQIAGAVKWNSAVRKGMRPLFKATDLIISTTPRCCACFGAREVMTL